MNVFWCEATLKPLDQELIQSPTTNATPDPMEGPETTSILGEDYIFLEEQVVEVDYQSHDTLTSDMSIMHHNSMELKDVIWGVSSELRNDNLVSEASTFYVSDLELQPKVCEVDNEVQEMPTFHISSMEFLTEPEGQRFLSLYSVGNLIGTGGFGSVYEGVCKSDGQPVAIKLIPEKDSYLHINIPGETSKLYIEVALMKILSRPPLCKNVVQLLDWFEISNCLLLVLERPVPCMDVFNLYECKNDELDEPLAKIIMLQVVEAAHHCYKQGVFHSDIKMENILFNLETLDVKLIDFGCGNLWMDTPYKNYAGTEDFWPPEWILQQQYHAYTATVWSLGVLLYCLVCEKMPFMNKEEIVDGTLHFGPGLSKDCRHLIKWCLKQDPTERPSFMQISRHQWFTNGLHLTGMELQEEMGGAKSKADDTLMPETSHQPKVGDMAVQTSEDAFPEHVDSQQILRTLKKHFSLNLSLL